MAKIGKENLGQSTLKNTFWNFFFNIVTKAGGLIFTIVMARLLLPELFGQYALALSVILLLLGLIEYGINLTSLKYVSEELGKNNKVRARSYFKFCLLMKIFVAGFLAIALFLLSRVISENILNKPYISLSLQIGALYLFVTSLLTSFLYFAYSVKKIKYVFASEAIFQVSRILLVSLFIGILKYRVESILFALILSSSFSLVFLFIITKKKYPFLLHGETVEIDKKRLMKFLFFTSIAGISTTFFLHVDTVMLGALISDTSVVGFYQVALNIVTGIAALMSFAQVSFPVFAQLRGKKLAKFFEKFVYYSAIISIPSAIGLIFVVKPFIIYLFGTEYLAAIIPLYILSFLIVEMVTGVFFNTILISKGKPQYVAKITLVTAIISILLNFIFIKWLSSIKPIYGALGAAIAAFISRYFYVFSLAIISKRELNVGVRMSLILKPIFASIIMVIPMIIISNIQPLSILFSTIAIVIGAILYFTVLIFIKGINREDIKLLKLLILRKKSIDKI
ncbi:MAG: flippase [archaeon]